MPTDPTRPLLVLASSSPRRSALLRAAGIMFVLGEPGPEPDGHGTPIELAQLRARSKAHGATAPSGVEAPLLGVDTVVDLDGEELPKPRDRAAAAVMLARLAGRDHRVHTAHCLVDRRRGLAFETTVTSVVGCGPYDAAAIARYLDSGEWRGKAGAYGIQDQTQSFVTLRSGPFDAVVGLAVDAVRELLQKVASP